MINIFYRRDRVKKIIIILLACMFILCSCTSDNDDVTEKCIALGESENWEARLMPIDDLDQDGITIRFMTKKNIDADRIGFSCEISGKIIQKEFEDFSLKENEYISVSFGGHTLDTKALESNDLKVLVTLNGEITDNFPLKIYKELNDNK